MEEVRCSGGYGQAEYQIEVSGLIAFLPRGLLRPPPYSKRIPLSWSPLPSPTCTLVTCPDDDPFLTRQQIGTKDPSQDNPGV